LHAGQKRAWNSERRFPFVIAGTQGGKTSFGPWWLYREIQSRGPGDYLAVTATYDLFKLKMLPEMRLAFGSYLGWRWRSGDRIFTDGESRVILRSAHVPEGLESATVKAAWLDECGQDSFRLESWEAVQRRLSLSQGRALGTTTPYNLGWLKSEIFDKWRAGNSDIDVIQFKSTMNPDFPRAEYDRMRDALPAWKFRMFYDGDFTRPAGMIYSDFDDNVHKIAPFPIPPEWPRYVGLDPGAVNQALVWIAENPDNNTLVVYRESLSGNRTTREHAAEALELARSENVVAWTGGAKSEQQQRWDWQDAGVNVQAPTIHEVEPGIDRVISLFKQKRLFVFDTCKGLLDEIGTYARELDLDGNPTEKIRDKNKFHRLDALRYGVQPVTDVIWAIY